MGDVEMIAKVERTVCDAVNAAFATLRACPSEASPETLYAARGNVALPVATARHFCFKVLHDSYGLPYSAIARRAGYRVGAVMKKVRKVRAMQFTDRIYMAVGAEIARRLAFGAGDMNDMA